MAQMGMDVDAVEAAGRQLQAKAQSIDSIVAQVNKSVSSLNGVWEGRDADSFNASWPAIQKAIAAAGASVAGLGQSAITNAGEQREASSSTGASTSPVSLASFPGTVPNLPVGPSMEDQIWNGTESVVNSDVPGSPWSIDQIGSLIPGVGTGFDVVSIANSLHSGQIPVFRMVGVASGALRDDPATYLAGTALGVWNSVAQDVQTAIAAGPPTNDLGYIASDPVGAFGAAMSAEVQALPDLIGDVLPGFLK